MDDLQALVNDIHREIAVAHRAGKVADYIPQLAAVDPKHFGIADHDGGRAGVRGRRGRYRLLDPEHLQGVHADACARHGRRPALEPGRPRAIGHSVQLDRPARARAGQAAQSLHQCRRHRGGRRAAGRAPAEGGDRRDRAVRPLPGGRRDHRHRPARRPLGDATRASAISRLPSSCAPSASSIIRPSMCSASISTTARSP